MEEAKSCRMNNGTLIVYKFRSGSFKLEKAVCNHGFFMMSPNRWIPSRKSLCRPLRLADSASSVEVSITEGEGDRVAEDDPNMMMISIHILVHSSAPLSPEDGDALRRQVARMLRASPKDERDVTLFHRLHSQAKEAGFGRLFRSPTLFEDAVKSILLCNTQWHRSLSMATSLCHLQSELDSESTTELGNFPTAKELANLSEQELAARCKLGYRAKHIIKLAKEIERGSFKLEDEALRHNQVYKKWYKKKGFGPFACANVLMCIGFYELVPVDSETVRHLKQTHGKERCCKKTVGEIYNKYSPFQCLAYWMEMVEYYERRLGKLSELPHSSYHATTGTSMRCGLISP